MFGLDTVGDLERLVSRCQRGDSEAWSQVVDRFQALVYSIPKKYGLTEEDAADVFQTTFQSLLKNIDRISAAAALPKWLAVTAARESLKIRRIRGRTVDSEAATRTLDEVVAGEESDAERTAVEADQARRVREAVADMSEKCRKLLELLYFEDDVSYQDVSTLLNIPVGAIGPTRARCLDKLRRELTQSDFF